MDISAVLYVQGLLQNSALGAGVQPGLRLGEGCRKCVWKQSHPEYGDSNTAGMGAMAGGLRQRWPQPLKRHVSRDLKLGALMQA